MKRLILAPSLIVIAALCGCNSTAPKKDPAPSSAPTSAAAPEVQPPADQVPPPPPQLTPEQQIADSSAISGAQAAPENITWGEYTVQSGDSLWLIAKKHETTVKKITEANTLQGTLIHPGMKLKVPVSSKAPTPAQ